MCAKNLLIVKNDRLFCSKQTRNLKNVFLYEFFFVLNIPKVFWYKKISNFLFFVFFALKISFKVFLY